MLVSYIILDAIWNLLQLRIVTVIYIETTFTVLRNIISSMILIWVTNSTFNVKILNLFLKYY